MTDFPRKCISGDDTRLNENIISKKKNIFNSKSTSDNQNLTKINSPKALYNNLILIISNIRK